MKKYSEKTKIELSRIEFWGMVLLIVMLGILLWSNTRQGEEPKLAVAQPGELLQLIPSIVGLTQSSVENGNSVTVLENGAFFHSLLADIAKAQHTIHVESYVWWKGEICERVAAALAAKARSGVEVRVLLDASGSSRMDDKLFESMKAAGCHVAKFHPVRLGKLGRLNNRDHRKITVIDGRIGYIGGHGFAEEWTGNAQDKKHFRDTFLRTEGPIVNRLQGAFCENWIEETGEIPAGEKYYPKPQNAGNIPMHLAYSSPKGSVSSVQLLYYLAIVAAKHELLIQNPYFLPDNDALDALIAAKKRGVDVQIMLPAATVNDSPLVQHASHHHFGTLLKHGIRIFEYQKTLLHQKIMIVDGTWSCVGSTNFDDRSFKLNDEISVGIVDRGIAAQLRQAWDADMKFCQERKFEEWKNRGLWHKLRDGLAYSTNSQL
ncbi:MAG TPA: cardiolipin synthase [Thermoanaerobaculia bacterium]|nr:cardiolipin synthase [Thermoanaerobaculia bacterium]